MIRISGRDSYGSKYASEVNDNDSSFSPSVIMDHDKLHSSRHLWVGNISPRITESVLAEQFVRFGELESIALYPSRGYAFVNFKKDEDAFLALRELQGISVAGFALKIEFAKGAKASRHLHVTGISPSISGKELENEFCKIGVLERFKFDQDRCVAWVDYMSADDAVTAVGRLNRKMIGKCELRVDYMSPDPEKQERQLSSFSYVRDFQQNSYQRSSSEDRASFSPRDSKMYSAGFKKSIDRSKGEDSGEPSEILWIGFPVQLNIDEMTLRRAFSPFGQIEKITTFPGRSYAFVKFRSIMEACRAKDALQGKLFNNPRVSICFSKSESGPTDYVKGSNDQFLRSTRSAGSHGCSNRVVGAVHQEKIFDQTGEFLVKSPHFISKFERTPGDFSANIMHKNVAKGMGQGSAYNSVGYENLKFEVDESEFGFAQNMLERSKSNVTDKDVVQGIPMGRTHDDNPYFEKSWDSPGEDTLYRNKKKPKMTFDLHKDLPEFPLSNSLHGIHVPQRAFHANNTSTRSLCTKSTKELEKGDPWSPNDNVETTYTPLLMDSVKWDRFSRLQHRSALDEEWKWQGTIAKGGTPICRACCFPVGKVLDITLPEFLNCTARTGLDMLAKHFSQASGVGVVFFVPESDSDIVFYNEFMYYLGEKQRAAVAKLGEKTTLFLVPPSEFSEKVLKVPGKMSISGVVLMFEHVNGPIGTSQTLDSMNSVHLAPRYQLQDDEIYDEDQAGMRLRSPDSKLSVWNQRIVMASSEPASSAHCPLPSMHKVDGLDNHSYAQRFLSSASSSASTGNLAVKLSKTASKFDQDANPNQSLPTTLRKTSSGVGDHIPLDPSYYRPHSFENSAAPEYLVGKKSPIEGSSSQYIPEGITSLPAITVSHPQIRRQVSSPMTVPQLPPQQLAELASLLIQRQPSESFSSLSTKESPSVLYFEHSKAAQNSSYQGQDAASGLLASSFGKVLPSPLHASRNQPIPLINSVEIQVQKPENPEKLLPHGKEEVDSDPQKRLQATLQLAAALLQQIQQKGNPADRP